MTTTRDLTRLQELTDRADPTDLLTRQGLWLDEGPKRERAAQRDDRLSGTHKIPA